MRSGYTEGHDLSPCHSYIKSTIVKILHPTSESFIHGNNIAGE